MTTLISREEPPTTSSDPASRHLTDTLLSSHDLPDEVRWGIGEAGFVFATPIQEKVLPLALAGQDVAGPGADRHRQDRRLSHHDLHAPAPPPAPAPRAAPRALVIAPTRELVVQIRDDARGLLGAATGLSTLRRVRRHRLPQAARRRPAGARPAGRNAGPAARLRAAGRDDFRGRRDPRHRRGRPHVRHGIHQGPALHPPPLPAVRPAPVDALLGHAPLRRHGARLRVHEQRREGRGRAGAGAARTDIEELVYHVSCTRRCRCCWGCCGRRAAAGC